MKTLLKGTVMDYKELNGSVCAPAGFSAGAAATGIKKDSRADMAIILCEDKCPAAAVFTTNKVKSAPVVVSRENLKSGYCKGILCNSVNANACNPTPLETAKKSAAIIARATGTSPCDFALASTGVIGQELPLEHFEKGIPAILSTLSESDGSAAARAIMTTDTVPKEFAIEFEAGGTKCRLGAIGKGSGMININMATMLVFITTDISITPQLLDSALRDCVRFTLNQVYIDGDMSTNDTTVIMASGKAGNPAIQDKGEDYAAFCSALTYILTKMSRALAKDGEGATKLIECNVINAPDDETAHGIAKSVVGSDLFKAAMFASDANWGRAICAVGYAPGGFSVDNITISQKSSAGEVTVCRAPYNNLFPSKRPRKYSAVTRWP
jgi:glutamate N-acetyltransferase/amino-acid N-acetyltransferase